MKNILFIASEGVPFIKTGGLADVVGSLPKCIDREYYDVRVMIPKYSCMSDKMKEKLSYRAHFYMDFHWKDEYVGILESEVDGVKYYFIRTMRCLRLRNTRISVRHAFPPCLFSAFGRI